MMESTAWACSWRSWGRSTTFLQGSGTMVGQALVVHAGIWGACMVGEQG